jgi:hypothetical protein
MAEEACPRRFAVASAGHADFINRFGHLVERPVPFTLYLDLPSLRVLHGRNELAPWPLFISLQAGTLDDPWIKLTAEVAG